MLEKINTKNLSIPFHNQSGLMLVDGTINIEFGSKHPFYTNYFSICWYFYKLPSLIFVDHGSAPPSLWLSILDFSLLPRNLLVQTLQSQKVILYLLYEFHQPTHLL